MAKSHTVIEEAKLTEKLRALAGAYHDLPLSDPRAISRAEEPGPDGQIIMWKDGTVGMRRNHPYQPKTRDEIYALSDQELSAWLTAQFEHDRSLARFAEERYDILDPDMREAFGRDMIETYIANGVYSLHDHDRIRASEEYFGIEFAYRTLNRSAHQGRK